MEALSCAPSNLAYLLAYGHGGRGDAQTKHLMWPCSELYCYTAALSQYIRKIHQPKRSPAPWIRHWIRWMVGPDSDTLIFHLFKLPITKITSTKTFTPTKTNYIWKILLGRRFSFWNVPFSGVFIRSFRGGGIPVLKLPSFSLRGEPPTIQVQLPIYFPPFFQGTFFVAPEKQGAAKTPVVPPDEEALSMWLLGFSVSQSAGTPEAPEGSWNDRRVGSAPPFVSGAGKIYPQVWFPKTHSIHLIWCYFNWHSFKPLSIFFNSLDL